MTTPSAIAAAPVIPSRPRVGISRNCVSCSPGTGRRLRTYAKEAAPAKAVGVECGTRFLKTHPVVDPISHGWYFDDPVFLKDLTFTLAGDMDRNVIPTRVTIPIFRLVVK